jgi:methionyl-tRNA formyltransferase
VTKSLRVAFAGTPPFAVAALEAIADSGFEIPLVLSQPDRRQGRGMKLAATAVKTAAFARGIPVATPASLKDERTSGELRALPIDVLVVAAYGLILPPAVLAWPRHGCINIHASLLPRWRGAAPIQRALLAGDTETGISIMQMDAGLDTGPVIAALPVAVASRETAGSLLEKLATAGAEGIVRTLHRLEHDGRVDATPQAESGVTYAAKIGAADANIDWHADAHALDRQIRALNPAPGAATTVGGVLTKLWNAEPVRGRFGVPGTVVRVDDTGIVVACGNGALVVRELQRAGGRRMSAAAFIAGNPLAANAALDMGSNGAERR